MFTTPLLVNIDRRSPLPEGCGFRYTNQDPAVPEVVECLAPPLPHGALTTLRLPVTAVDAAAPTVSTYGILSVLPAPGSADTDTSATNSSLTTVFNIQQGPPQAVPAGSTPVDLYLVGDTPAISPGGTGMATFSVGNSGPHPTSGTVRAVYVTPLFVNVDHRLPLPPECTMLLADADPSVPEIVQCVRTVPLSPHDTWSERIPLTVVPGGPQGQNFGTAIVTAGTPAAPGCDFETRLADNVFGPSVNTIA
ncbi:hypothetical protein ACFV6F_32570 [Kitasatospora phosalacinea]|uniref:hypothetical protein n=1 Tax=Kitasatospora phosalacinea TaxID=2065 RepID=UPI00365749E0